MKTKTRFTICAMVLVVLPVLLVTAAWAQVPGSPPIKISIVSDNTTYGPEDPIKIQVKVFNDPDDSVGEVISWEGYLDKNFHLMITFIDPDGNHITNRFAMVDPEPGPPHRLSGRNAVLAEIIPPDGENLIVIDDAHEYYDLTKHGWYTAQIRVPLETFSEYVTGPGDNLFAYLDDPGRQSFNSIASNEIRFEIAPSEPVVTSSINTTVSLLQIGGGSTPGATKMIGIRFACS